MSRVSFTLPTGARMIYNELYRTGDPRFLKEDLLTIELPDNRFVDVGWYPEHDPQGAYRVCLHQDDDWFEPMECEVTPELRRVIAIVNSYLGGESTPAIEEWAPHQFRDWQTSAANSATFVGEFQPA